MTILLKSISQKLAYNTSQLRNQRGMTQIELAKLAGIPRSTLTHLESGAGNPSLMNLTKLAGALQVSIEELLATPRAQCKLVKSADLPVLKRSQGQALLYKLLPDPVPGMEFDRLEIEPGARMGGVPHMPGTREYLTCFQGETTVHITGERYRLEAGDVLAFPGDQHHSYQNTGKIRSINLSVVILAPVGI
jgi:transcriptional regulator with XRE-family HTH domain